jgi:predicted small lipoprotein YifL
MRRVLSILAIALLAATLSACGTKGDLVKPDAAAAKKPHDKKAESPQP